MGLPAARKTDTTSHGGSIVGGATNVLFGGPGAARLQDPHVCPLAPPIGPHPPNPIVMGASNILVNKRMATVMTSATGDGSVIVGACNGNIEIGGPFVTVAARYGKSLILKGTPAEIEREANTVNAIADSGADGRAQIDALNNDTRPTEVNIATGNTPYGDSVNGRGGGLTYDQGDHNEIYYNPDFHTNYRSESDPPGTESATENENGLLNHEMGHAQGNNEHSPAQTAPDPAPDNEVISRTNGTRSDLGLPKEHSR